MPLAWALLAGASIWGFWATGRRHGGYDITVVGTDFIPASELVFDAWFALWGGLALFALARALLASGLAADLARGFQRATSDRYPVVIALAAAVVSLLALTVHVAVTRALPLSDDEHVYAFVARTLLAGHLTNPPPSSPELFENVFTVLSDRGWFGKYPIGHPLVLAIGEAVGLRALVVPALAGVNLVLTYRLGRHLFDAKVALAGALLLCLSPHYVLTYGTQLSQPTACTFMLLAALCSLRGESSDGYWGPVLAGLSLAAGIVVRPMPGGLFVAAVLLAMWLGGRSRRPWPATAARIAVTAAVAGLGVVCVYAVNSVQAGAGVSSGYHLAGAEAGVAPKLFFAGTSGAWASSLGGAVLREMFWFLGWPGAALLTCLARPKAGASLLWGLVGALLAYRVAVPKTFMAVTGPVYVTEALPLLALAAADGLRRLGGALPSGAGRTPGALAVALFGAGVVVAASMFLPIQLRVIDTATSLRARVYAGLSDAGASRALVFANHLVSPQSRRAWAYFPPSPSPDLADDVVFVRIPRGSASQAHQKARAFWQRNMADRRAFIFVPSKDGQGLSELHP